MLNYFISENLKFRRTFSRKIIVIAPFFFILFAYFTQSNLRTQDHYYMEMVFNWWPLIFMTEGTAILCALSNAKDKKAGENAIYHIYDISGSKYWLSKVFTVAFYLLISTVVLILVVFTSSKIFIIGIAPLSEIITAGIIIWITSIAMIPFYLFLAYRFGTVFTVISGIVGMALSVIFATKKIWICVPWSWSIRLMCPIVGVRPNGVALSANDILRDSSVIPLGIMASIIFLVITGYLTCRWFSRGR